MKLRLVTVPLLETGMNLPERPNYLAMRNLLSGLRNEMAIGEGDEPKPETMKEIREQAAKLVELALERKQ